MNPRRTAAIAAAGIMVAGGTLAPGLTGTAGASGSAAADGVISRVSMSSRGVPANDDSYLQAVSRDGRYVAFQSSASNLVPGDTNHRDDVFVHDRSTHRTTRVSVSSQGGQLAAFSANPAMSADGRYVAFDTGPTPAPGSVRRGVHVYVHDRTTGRTARVSVSSGGTQGNGNSERARLSANGRYVTFDSAATDLVPGDTNRASDLFFHDRSTGKTSRTSVTSTGAQIGGGHSWAGDISSDGRSVAFSTAARDVVPGDTNGATDIFVRDRVAHTTTRVSVAADGRELNSWNWSSTLSADGRYVAFYTNATNAVPGDTTVGHVVIRELRTGQVQVLAAADHPSLSTDGRYLAHLGWGADPAVGSGLYVEDLRAGQTRTVAVDAVDRSTYYDATPRISADGHHVTFATPARLTPDDTAWVQDVYVWNDRPMKLRGTATIMVAVGNVLGGTIGAGGMTGPALGSAMTGGTTSWHAIPALPGLVRG